MNQVYIWAKKIHRLTMWLILGLGGTMMVTGLMLRFGIGLADLGIELAVRQLHRNTSGWFAAALSVMMMTGLVMYLYPYIIRWKTKPKLE